MYGTVARMTLKPGAEAEMMQLMDDINAEMDAPGYVTEYVYRMDNEPDVYYMAVLFKDRESYVANAADPKMHERFLRYRAFLASDPEWHDGEVIWPR